MNDQRGTVAVVTRRPATAADEPLLHELFVQTRPELALLDPELRGPLVDLQWRARQREYAAAHPHARQEVLVVDGAPVGQLMVAEAPGAVRIVDVSVHADHRGRGIGSSVLRDVIAEAERRGRMVGLSVWSENAGARRLYDSLGFVATETVPAGGVGYVEMSRSADG